MSEIINKISSFFHWMQECIDTIISFFTTIGHILVSVINYARLLLDLIPSWLYAIVGIILVICGVYVVLGRTGNG